MLFGLICLLKYSMTKKIVGNFDLEGGGRTLMFLKNYRCEILKNYKQVQPLLIFFKAHLNNYCNNEYYYSKQFLSTFFSLSFYMPRKILFNLFNQFQYLSILLSKQEN